MLLRLAMIFALCDLQTRIDVQHIQAAMGWIRHGVESAKFVFLKATVHRFVHRHGLQVKAWRVHLVAHRDQVDDEATHNH
jgi:hypothetical protein